jgi:hypothetical protein
MTTLAVAYQLLQYPGQFFGVDGEVLAGGKLSFVVAGTSTPAPVYHDCNGLSAWTDPVVLDSSGAADIFLSPILYDVSGTDADDVPVAHLSALGVGNPGQIFAASYGTVQTQGSKAVASGYSILATDNCVTYISGSPGTVNLPAASVRSSANTGNGLPLLLANYGASTWGLVPSGADLVNNVNATLTLTAGQTALAYSDGISAWYVVVSG